MNRFTLKILWSDNNIGIAIDHIEKEGYSPLTSYFFWPRNNSWIQIKNELESKPWISENDRVNLLNQTTNIINYWQENTKRQSATQVQNKFSEFTFYGDY